MESSLRLQSPEFGKISQAQNPEVLNLGSIIYKRRETCLINSK